ncbi:hypothetical protein EG329_004055 [Mollisiaceae sp. DMI_Dod_QoI]|nr:hypothetical protein EG329_004055 [Helotiales sp. DMI_Dod_QoI]
METANNATPNCSAGPAGLVEKVDSMQPDITASAKRGPGRPRKSESASRSPSMAPKKAPAKKMVPKDEAAKKTPAQQAKQSGPNIKYVKPHLSNEGSAAQPAAKQKASAPDPVKSAAALSQARTKGGKFATATSKPNTLNQGQFHQGPAWDASAAGGNQGFSISVPQHAQAAPFQDRRVIAPEPPTPAQPADGALQAQPNVGAQLIDGAGIPLGEVDSFLHRFLRLLAIEGPNPIYPPGGQEHTDTMKGIIDLTMNWQSAHVLLSDRYSLEHCAQNGQNVGFAIASRALALGHSNILQQIMEFFDKFAGMADKEIKQASREEEHEFQEWGYASWMWTQMMDREFFGMARDMITGVSRAENERIYKEREEKRVAEDVAKQKVTGLLEKISGKNGAAVAGEMEVENWDDMD